ncbi:MAG TPA: nicotinate phosphoribosyltransferase, partial [Burkholderiales bacterium]|nr:nicotinate phosphoribosyltransferase [Burkholderiales bacterium]
GASPSTAEIRTRATRQLAALPPRLRRLDQAAEPYRVDISKALRELAAQVDARTGAGTVT